YTQYQDSLAAARSKAANDYAVIQQENALRSKALNLGYGYDPSAYLSRQYLGVPPDPIYYGGGVQSSRSQQVATGAIPQSYVLIGLVALVYLMLSKKGHR